ncbi:MAG: hypothetical protein M1821_002516 [Bathelium mastoideum]|nr:MAG: hypothetical protein M1821_002516 [Bathelium mastoideum]
MANVSNDTQVYNSPEWFLSENVKTYEQLIEEGLGIGGIDIAPERSKNSSSEPPFQQWFREFCDTVAAAFVARGGQKALSFQPCLLVRTSNSEKEKFESSAFVGDIVSCVARELGADVISADLDDIFDISQEFFDQRRQADHDSGPDNEAGSDSENGRISLSDLGGRADSPNGLKKDIHDSPAKETIAKQACEQPQGYSQIDIANFCFATLSKKKASEESLTRTRQAISTILHTPELKRLGDVSRPLDLKEHTSDQAGWALILHLRRGTDFLRLNCGVRYFTRFCNHIKACRALGQRIIMIISTSYDVSSRDSDLGSVFYPRRTSHINMNMRKLARKLNIDAASTVTLLSQRPQNWDQLAKMTIYHRYRNANKRRIKKALRHHFMGNADVELLRYSTAWEETPGDNASLLEEALFSEDDVLKATRQIVGKSSKGSVLQLQDIFSVLGRIRTRNSEQFTKDSGGYDDGKSEEEDQNAVDDKNPDDDQNENTHDKTEAGSSGEKQSPYAAKIQKVREECNEYERDLLSCVVDPDEIKTTYDDVILDTEVKAKIRQLIKLSAFRASGKSRFLLSQAQPKGTLLYGPPGTGKTHFCRAIAKESKAIMLTIDSATIENKWIGESEKLIRAAFSLSAKLHPCILFIDEADALFYKRSHNDMRWARASLVQFLKEMDGLVTSQKSPFIIAATNQPGDLDDAFIRRLSQRIPFALPMLHQRHQILRIYLKDDDIDPSVNFDFLTRETAGYSGSDICILCGQAGLILAVEQNEQNPSPESEDGPVQIRLEMRHLLVALRTSFSSVSKESLEQIEAFEVRFGKHSTSNQVTQDRP